MHARFRIRTRDGEDLAPGTVEEFSELVRSGGLRPEDLVFDALTGEWAPARSHPMVQLFADPLAVDPTGEPPSEGPAPPGSPPGNPSSEAPQTEGDAAGDGDLNLDLVEFHEVTPEEEARAFIARMEEERRNDPALAPLLEAPPLVDPNAGSVVGLVSGSNYEEPEPPAREASHPESPSPQQPSPQRPSSRSPSPEPLEGSRPAARPAATPLEARRVPKRRPSSARYQSRRLKNGLILGAGMVAVALSVLWAPRRAVAPAEGDIARAEEAAEVARTVPVTEEETRTVALAAFVDAVSALADEMAVGGVPDMWLEGQYLADPVAYPEVRQYWERYLGFVDAARAAEVTLYRGAYLIAAADAGLSGPVRSLRLATAQQDFAATRDRRDIHYGRVEGLALAALALDDLLVDLMGRVTYEPIAGPRLSADPVIEAAGTDPEAQAALEAALDEVLAALQGPGGVPTRDRAGVPGWLAAGLQKVESAR